jgi:hypothetical protein
LASSVEYKIKKSPSSAWAFSLFVKNTLINEKIAKKVAGKNKRN